MSSVFSLRCSNSFTGVEVLIACNTPKCKVGISPPKWIFTFLCQAMKSCSRVASVKRLSSTVKDIFLYLLPFKWASALHLPRPFDKCSLITRPIEQSGSLSSKFKSLENHLSKWLRVEPVSIKASASMLTF